MNDNITITKSINAPLEKVWDYYNNPVHIVHWNFADPSWSCPSAENDLQAGGKYRARMEARDGSFGFDFEATYNSVEPGKSFTYTLTDGRMVNCSFETEGIRTKVTINFEAENDNSLQMQEQGWQAILNNFAAYAEEN